MSSAGGDRGRATDLEVLIPDAVFDGGVGLFTSLAVVEAIEVSLYLVGVTLFSVAPTRSGLACARRRSGRRPSTGCWHVSPPPSSARQRRRRTSGLRALSLQEHRRSHPGPHGAGDRLREARLGAGRLLRLPRRSARQRRRGAGREHDAPVRPAIGRRPRPPAAPNAGTASDALHRCVPDGAPQMRTPDHSNA